MKRLADIAAIVGNVVGAIFVAVGNVEVQVVGYLFFCMGCLASIWLLRHSNASKSLIFVGMYFFVVNIIGIVARIPSVTTAISKLFS